MTPEFEFRKKSCKISLWSEIREILVWGIFAYIIGFSSVVFSKYIRQVTFSLLGDAVYSIMFFIIVAYWRILIIKKCEEVLRQSLSARWREVLRTSRLVLYVILVWLGSIIMRAYLLPQFLKIDFSFLDMIIILVFYSFPFLFCIYTLVVYIPNSQYLASLQLESKERKKVADALTLVTPALGFPWLVAASLSLALAHIQIEPYWIIYLVFISIYVTFYMIFVDLPYSISAREIRKQKVDELERARNELLCKLEKIDNSKQKSLVEKIALESEIARIDREKQETKSQSIHPYKIIIPFASFFIGIFGAVFIEFVEKVLQLG